MCLCVSVCLSMYAFTALSGANTCCHLQELYLQNNYITDIGAVSLLHGIRTNKTLTSLNLAHNDISNGSVLLCVCDVYVCVLCVYLCVFMCMIAYVYVSLRCVCLYVCLFILVCVCVSFVIFV